jgi:hypothetical protein
VSGTNKGLNQEPRPRDAEKTRDLTEGAAAAERASAGMGTEDTDPAAWLFGDQVEEKHSG